jgi:hypothetical protein
MSSTPNAPQRRRAGAGAGGPLRASLLLASLLLAAAEGPRFAIYNPVQFHLEVVAGAVHVLQQLTNEPVTVFLPEKVGQRGLRARAGGP